jgi:hypothetical protein
MLMPYVACLVIRPTIALIGFDDGLVFGFIVGGLVACRNSRLVIVQTRKALKPLFRCIETMELYTLTQRRAAVCVNVGKRHSDDDCPLLQLVAQTSRRNRIAVLKLYKRSWIVPI